MKIACILCVVVFLCTAAFGQETLPPAVASTANIETRLSIVESRLGRLESDVSRLSAVPTALARIEEKLTALSERAGGNSDVLQSLGLLVVGATITGVLSYHFGKARASAQG